MAQAALRAAMGAFQESVWERRFATLAAGAAAAGTSPAGALEAIRAIPAQCARGRLLQRHALVALLRGAIPSQVSPTAQPPTGCLPAWKCAAVFLSASRWTSGYFLIPFSMLLRCLFVRRRQELRRAGDEAPSLMWTFQR